MILLKRFSEWRREALPKLSTTTVLRHYIPLSGAVSHCLYTVHVFSPNILQNLFPLYDTAVEHSLLSTSNIGLGFYLYFRPHLNRLKPWDRVEYSVFTTVLFNFGSLLTAIFLKALVPSRSNGLLKSLLAFGLSWILLSRGYKYIDLIDSRTKHKNNIRHKKPSKPLEVLTTI